MIRFCNFHVLSEKNENIVCVMIISEGLSEEKFELNILSIFYQTQYHLSYSWLLEENER
jgi:hypothetical protein